MSERAKRIFAIVLVAALAYVVYAQISGAPLVPGSGIPQPPPEPDSGNLDDLRQVASVQQVPLLGDSGIDYDLGGRNLFQYGRPKPPPPSPEELAAQRRAEEARLKAMEDAARERAEEQRRLREAQEKKAREAMEAMQKQKKPSDAQQKRAAKPPAPPINLRFVGVLGPPRSRIAVFLRQGNIVLGRSGEVIEGKYKVLSMGPESVLMGYTDPTFKGDTKRIVLGS